MQRTCRTSTITPKGKHIVDALSVGPSLSHLCPEHISKSIEVKLMKLDTLIEGHEENCRMQEFNPVTSIYRVTSAFNLCNKKLVQSISLKV